MAKQAEQNDRRSNMGAMISISVGDGGLKRSEPKVPVAAAAFCPHAVEVVQGRGAAEAVDAVPGTAPRQRPPEEGVAGVQVVRQQGAAPGGGPGRRGRGVQVQVLVLVLVLFDQGLGLRLHAALLGREAELFEGDVLAVGLRGQRAGRLVSGARK
ncbi:hypothetical protein EYF80_053171 [Liparis tanakae]|uniref:Uncharacterized protein n=1 Tax=Liparis tanakae TaxID=230148 RepID=A0A4Z2F7A0_9TELE|nr:hypothetical protein EYF80_053171 [Liparis tanakae]